MQTALMWVGGSAIVVCALLVFYSFEDRKGERIVFPRFRHMLDHLVETLGRSLLRAGDFMGGRFLRLLIHYGLHTILKRLLLFLRSLEAKVEEIIRQNRRRAKDVTQPHVENHLDAIAQHKEEVALTEGEKRKLPAHCGSLQFVQK